MPGNCRARRWADRHAKQLAEFMPDCANVEQRCIRHRVDQDVQVAAIGVLAAQHGTKDPSIPGAVRLDHLPDRGAIRSQCIRWFHAFVLPQQNPVLLQNYGFEWLPDSIVVWQLAKLPYGRK